MNTTKTMDTIYDKLVSYGYKRITVNLMIQYSIFEPNGTLLGHENKVKEFLNKKKHERTN